MSETKKPPYLVSTAEQVEREDALATALRDAMKNGFTAETLLESRRSLAAYDAHVAAMKEAFPNVGPTVGDAPRMTVEQAIARVRAESYTGDKRLLIVSLSNAGRRLADEVERLQNVLHQLEHARSMARVEHPVRVMDRIDKILKEAKR